VRFGPLRQPGCPGTLQYVAAAVEKQPGSKPLGQRRENTIPAGAVMKYKGFDYDQVDQIEVSDAENTSDRD